MEFEKVIKERCATRSFDSRKIEQEKLDKILEAGRIAPTAKNIQPIKTYTKEDYSTYEMDASIVATHMMLEATNIGVDNIWVELFDREILRKEFNIPENLIPVCLLPIGYKSDKCPESPMHNIRKSIEEIVEYK